MDPVLEYISGFDTAYNRSSEIHHYGHVGEDISGVYTPEAYLELARTLAASAGRGDPGTAIRRRGNGDYMIFVENDFSAGYSHYGGIFLVVRARGSHGLLATMFAPSAGRSYFDNADDYLI
jgi:hypothetical protein